MKTRLTWAFSTISRPFSNAESHFREGLNAELSIAEISIWYEDHFSDIIFDIIFYISV